jgi:hypothetical protein
MGNPQRGQWWRIRSQESKIGLPPQLGHRNRTARQNSRAARRRIRHMVVV